jgi:alcohol dehydrogenase (cytochrome c)
MWPDKNGTAKLRKTMLWANGIFYVLDRATGEFLLGKPFVEINWMSGFDAAGKPIRVSGEVPTTEGTLVAPGNAGGTSWYSTSYSPRIGLFYVSTWVNYSSTMYKTGGKYEKGMSTTAVRSGRRCLMIGPRF